MKVQRPGVAASIALDVFVLRQVGAVLCGWAGWEQECWGGVLIGKQGLVVLSGDIMRVGAGRCAGPAGLPWRDARQAHMPRRMVGASLGALAYTGHKLAHCLLGLCCLCSCWRSFGAGASSTRTCQHCWTSGHPGGVHAARSSGPSAQMAACSALQLRITQHCCTVDPAAKGLLVCSACPCTLLATHCAPACVPWPALAPVCSVSWTTGMRRQTACGSRSCTGTWRCAVQPAKLLAQPVL